MRAVGVGQMLLLAGPVRSPPTPPQRPSVLSLLQGEPDAPSRRGPARVRRGQRPHRPRCRQLRTPGRSCAERSSSSSVCPSSSRPLPSSQTYDPWLLLAYLGPREGRLETPQQGLSAGGHAAASGGISGGHDSGRAHLASGGWRPGCHYTSCGTQDSPHPTGRSPPRGRESPARKARSAQSQVRPPCSGWTPLAFPTCVRSSD